MELRAGELALPPAPETGRCPRIRREADLARRSRPGMVHRPGQGNRASSRETAAAGLPEVTIDNGASRCRVAPGKLG